MLSICCTTNEYLELDIYYRFKYESGSCCDKSSYLPRIVIFRRKLRRLARGVLVGRSASKFVTNLFMEAVQRIGRPVCEKSTNRRRAHTPRPSIPRQARAFMDGR